MFAKHGWSVIRNLPCCHASKYLLVEEEFVVSKSLELNTVTGYGIDGHGVLTGENVRPSIQQAVSNVAKSASPLQGMLTGQVPMQI